MSVKQKYIKDENGEIFSPVISSSSIYHGTGNDASPQALMATLQSDTKYLTTSGWQITRIILDNAKIRIGKEFTLSNGRIIIGKGIKYVKASSMVQFWNSPDSTELSGRIVLYGADGTVKSTMSNNSSKLSNAGMGLFGNAIPNCFFEVTSGDYFMLDFAPSATGEFTIIGRNVNTFLCIEKIC